jgi:hypothetical protein
MTVMPWVSRETANPDVTYVAMTLRCGDGIGPHGLRGPGKLTLPPRIPAPIPAGGSRGGG